MRRLVLLAFTAVALGSGLAAAQASHECYGVDAGRLHAGICAGGHCSDLCFIVVDPYCYRDTRAPADYCGNIDDIG